MGVRRKSVYAAVRAELVKVSKLETALGSTALVLAARLDMGEDPGSAMAAMAKELRTILESLSAGTSQVGDPLDELKRQREKRLNAAR